MTKGECEDSLSPRSHEDSPPPPPQKTSRNGTKDLKSRRGDHTKIIQVANIAPQATRDQMQTLFGYIGKIDDLRLYPTVDLGIVVTSKICFVKFYESSSVGVSQHLTNTVFIDRALIVIPFIEGEIPDEQKALELLTSGTLLPGIADPKLPQHVSSQLEGIPPHQVVVTTDPQLIESRLPSYPNLPPNYDTRKIEEIRRTLVIANVDPQLRAQEVVDHFNMAGEIKYFRFCTRDNDPLHYALIEFTDQPSILDALKMNGQTMGSKIIKVYHAAQAIIKPQAKTNEAAQKEIEDAMSRQAQNLLSQGLDNTSGAKEKNRRSRSRTRSPRRRSISPRRRRTRSRSRSRRPRSRTRSRSRHRSTSRHREVYRKSKKSRSRSRERKRSRSRERKRSRSKGRHNRRSRSRSRSHKRSRKKDEKEKKKPKKDKDKDREKDEKKSRDKERDRDKTKEKERDKKEKDFRENGVKSEERRSID